MSAASRELVPDMLSLQSSADRSERSDQTCVWPAGLAQPLLRQVRMTFSSPEAVIIKLYGLLNGKLQRIFRQSWLRSSKRNCTWITRTISADSIDNSVRQPLEPTTTSMPRAMISLDRC